MSSCKHFVKIIELDEALNHVNINVIFTSSTPILRQASKKLSTFLLARAVVNFGCNKHQLE